MSNQKKQDEKKNEANSVVPAVTLAVVGAGIAAAGAMFLKEKKNRNMVKKEFANVKDQVVGFVDNMKNKTQDKADKLEKNLAKA